MTLVTSLILQRNGSMTHSLQKYLDNFKYISDLDLKIIFFLDRSIKIPEWIPNNVKVIPINIQELETFDLIKNATEVTKGEGVSFNPKKNTIDYMIIQNAKPELLYKSFHLSNDEVLFWLDSGVTHIMKTPEQTLKKLYMVKDLEKGLIIPGCWQPNDYLNDINWRFCGGFFKGERDIIEDFYKQSKEAIIKIMPKATWEVNVWAWMEKNMSFPFKWYQADHNDTFFDFERYLQDKRSSKEIKFIC